MNILLKLYFILRFTISQVLLGSCECVVFHSENHLQAQECTFYTKAANMFCQGQERGIFSTLLNCKYEYCHTESCKHKSHFIAIFLSHDSIISCFREKKPQPTLILVSFGACLNLKCELCYLIVDPQIPLKSIRIFIYW